MSVVQKDDPNVEIMFARMEAEMMEAKQRASLLEQQLQGEILQRRVQEHQLATLRHQLQDKNIIMPVFPAVISDGRSSILVSAKDSNNCQPSSFSPFSPSSSSSSSFSSPTHRFLSSSSSSSPPLSSLSSSSSSSSSSSPSTSELVILLQSQLVERTKQLLEAQKQTEVVTSKLQQTVKQLKTSQKVQGRMKNDLRDFGENVANAASSLRYLCQKGVSSSNGNDGTSGVFQHYGGQIKRKKMPLESQEKEIINIASQLFVISDKLQNSSYVAMFERLSNDNNMTQTTELKSENQSCAGNSLVVSRTAPDLHQVHNDLRTQLRARLFELQI